VTNAVPPAVLFGSADSHGAWPESTLHRDGPPFDVCQHPWLPPVNSKVLGLLRVKQARPGEFQTVPGFARGLAFVVQNIQRKMAG
jgi:hypothetical protein